MSLKKVEKVLGKWKRTNDKPTAPVNMSFRSSISSQPGPSDTHWFNVDQSSPNHLPTSTDSNPEWPDLGPALRESERPEFLPPGTTFDVDTEPTAAQSMELGPTESHPLKPADMGSHSPERKHAKLMHIDADRSNDVKELRRQLRQMESEHEKILKKSDEKHAREGHQLKEQHKASMQGLSNELKVVTKEARDQAVEVKKLKQEVMSTKTAAEQDRRRIHADHAGKITRLENELQTAKNDNVQRERRIAQSHADEIKTLNVAIQSTKSKADERERRVAWEHDQALNRLKETHATQLSKLEEEHRESKRQQQLEIEELNEAWLNRDDEIYQSMLFTTAGLPRKPDDKIKSQVLELQQMVDDLSRIEWKPSPAVWTDRVFQKIGNQQYSQRSLRKAIVQDLIWSLLFQWIFCSPFRMFGEEGLKLEREWNEQCDREKSSKDELYIWPPPSIKNERWRYMTIKECREILTKPLPSHVDKRAEIKRGYKTTQDKLITILEDELDHVMQLNEQELELIEKIAKKAAVTWLDFTMHRCRIRIRLPGAAAKTTTDKVAAIQRGSFSLTVLPLVGRYGNVKGVELDHFTIIKDYEGSTLDIT